ncbi:MAG: anthranilate synthase component I [Methanosarcinales archaeon]|nr:anthranilate synthase component I [Methanosarcinales archaeon]
MITPNPQELTTRLESIEPPAIIQLIAKTTAQCTPIDLYTVLKSESPKYSYLLESVEKEKHHARFSFVGSDPDAVITINGRDISLSYERSTPLIRQIEADLSDIHESGVIRPEYDVLDALKPIIPSVPYICTKNFDRQVFSGGAIGYHGYDIVYDCWMDIRRRDHAATPDAQFMLITHTVVFDHLTGEVYIILTQFLQDFSGDAIARMYRNAESDAAAMIAAIRRAEELNSRAQTPGGGHGQMTANAEQDEFEAMVGIAKQHIVDGDIFQVVLSRRYEATNTYSPIELYTRLREVNPSPYMYLFEFGETKIVGASPETLFTVHNRKLITNPIAGTCPRGETDAEDAELGRKLLSDEKERAEHVMLVDLGRNDVRMVSKPGTVRVEDFMTVRKYSHLQHIESTVTGILRDDADAFDATRAIFPAGTLSGAPKIRAMEIIDALEKDARGIYGGGVGYYTWNKDADFAIVIRTIVLDGDRMLIQAGAGIVADSDPTYEYLETERKMAAMMKVIE